MLQTKKPKRKPKKTHFVKIKSSNDSAETIRVIVLCEYSKFRIITSVFDSIGNEYNYSKFSNTYHHQFLTLKNLRKFHFLTEWRRFITLATMPSNQQNQYYIGPLWPTKY